MKYPWVAISLATVWFGSTFLILKSTDINANTVLFVAILGTVAMAYLGFKAPKLK